MQGNLLLAKIIIIIELMELTGIYVRWRPGGVVFQCTITGGGGGGLLFL